MKKFKYSIILIILAAFFIGFYLGSRHRIPEPAQSLPTENNKITNKPSEQSIALLDLPLEYFSKKDVQWGSGNNMADYTQIALADKAVYQSYPTKVITMKSYSSEIKSLKTKTFNQLMQAYSQSEIEGYGRTIVKENYQTYGSLATNYLPTHYIWNLDNFDVDGDGVAETIVSTNSTGAADAGSYHSDIIKGNNIIFSVQEDNARIVPADTTNGFYVEWRGADDFVPRCCSQGFMRTRFVFKDGKFVPIYEQQVKYLKVGKE